MWIIDTKHQKSKIFQVIFPLKLSKSSRSWYYYQKDVYDNFSTTLSKHWQSSLGFESMTMWSAPLIIITSSVGLFSIIHHWNSSIITSSSSQTTKTRLTDPNFDFVSRPSLEKSSMYILVGLISILASSKSCSINTALYHIIFNLLCILVKYINLSKVFILASGGDCVYIFVLI